MALIPTPAKTVLILLIRVPSIFLLYCSAELRTVNNVRHILWMKNVSPSLIIQRHQLVVGNGESLKKFQNE
jgi:hypothetical protein